MPLRFQTELGYVLPAAVAAVRHVPPPPQPSSELALRRQGPGLRVHGDWRRVVLAFCLTECRQVPSGMVVMTGRSSM